MFPYHIWKIILSSVTSVEDLKTFRLVCREWKSIIDPHLTSKVKVIFTPYNFREASVLFNGAFVSVVILNPHAGSVASPRFRMKSLLLSLPTHLQRVAIVDSQENGWSIPFVKAYGYTLTSNSSMRSKPVCEIGTDKTISSVDADFFASLMAQRTQQVTMYHSRGTESGLLTHQQFVALDNVFNNSLAMSRYHSWSRHNLPTGSIRKSLSAHIHVIPSQMEKYENLLRKPAGQTPYEPLPLSVPFCMKRFTLEEMERTSIEDSARTMLMMEEALKKPILFNNHHCGCVDCDLRQHIMS